MPFFPHVFSISPGSPFLSTLVDAVFEGKLFKNWTASRENLADLTIFVPTRRAARALEVLFSERFSSQALLLPRIIPLGETEEAELDLAINLPFSEAEQILAPSLSSLERRLIFARLIQSWAKHIDRSVYFKDIKEDKKYSHIVPTSPSDALVLAQELERLMDGLTVENISWDCLKQAVETDFSEYFLLTLEFIKIAKEAWPNILLERQASDPVQRRHALLFAEAKRLNELRPDAPVLAAGSTGSLPSTATLLKAISHLSNGAVILPGIDFDLDEASFDKLGERQDALTSIHGHPQALMYRLITDFFQIKRNDITLLGNLSDNQKEWNWFLSESLRPAETTDLWARYKNEERQKRARIALQHCSLVEVDDEREESLSISIVIREMLEQPDSTTLLITPDRNLAERVKADLKRWDISVEDSAGIPLSLTQIGIFARLIAEATASHFAPQPFLALLKHPFLSCSMKEGERKRAIELLELALFRGLEPLGGFKSLFHHLEMRRSQRSSRDPFPLKRLTDEDWELGKHLLLYLEKAFSSFNFMEESKESDLIAFAQKHLFVIEQLLKEPEVDDTFQDNPEHFGYNDLVQLFDDLSLINAGAFLGKPEEYPTFFMQLLNQKVLFPQRNSSPKHVKIMGLLEARLMHADCIILAGLDEGIWPPKTEADAFLNRPMRAALGLSSPERRIGQTAHDFSQAIAQGKVVLTHALKRDGTPTLPSRFLQRMRAFSGDEPWAELIQRGQKYRNFAHLIEEKQSPTRPVQRPALLSRKDTFPLSLNVTEIEVLIRDPYAIFARHILKLDPLPSVGSPPGPADFGTMLHDVINRFSQEFSGEIPDNALDHLVHFGTEALVHLKQSHPHLYVEWQERFKRIFIPFLAWDKDRRKNTKKLYTELPASWTHNLPDGRIFTLKGRADRLEWKQDDTFSLIDFKTGQPPGIKEVLKGFSPQLTLEAMMLKEAAFKDAPQTRFTPELLYVRLSGGKKPLELRSIDVSASSTETLDDIIARHKAIMLNLITRFSEGKGRYLSRPYAKYINRFSPYDHLARVREWSILGNEGEA